MSNSSPPLDASRDGLQLTIEEFRRGFRHGSISPWDHNQYLRAAYITLLEVENQELGLLDVATKFAKRMNSFKERNSQVKHQPESRTLTVFWLYHIRLAMKVTWTYQKNYGEYYNFKRLLHYIPEMADENLATAYYSPDILESEYSQKFWILPNLRELIEPPECPDLSFRGRFTKKQSEDPERLLRFAFAVVQRYLLPGETRRRSWFINLAFAALQQQTIRLRSMKPQVSPYSETQSYFYLQLVHAALSQFVVTGNAQLVQELSYPQFKDIFLLLPSEWTKYYSVPLWDSLKARASFVPPDLQPLPDTIPPPDPWLEPTKPKARERFHRLGLIPELPSLEILHFHQALLLEDAKPLPPTIPPSAVTTHAHLLKYIHTHLILPPPSPDDPTSTLAHHRHLLTTHSPLPKAHVTYYLDILHTLQPPYTPPPPPTRYHNCPCHATVPIPWQFIPAVVAHTHEHEHEQRQRHGCGCHGGEVVHGEGVAETGVGAAAGVAGVMEEVGREAEKSRGEGCGGRDGLESDGREGVGEGREGGNTDADEKTLRGEESKDERKERKGEGEEGGDADAEEKTLRGDEDTSEGNEGEPEGEEGGQVDADEVTLRGEDGGEDEDWEVVP
ncbi:hypothetical protein B0I37DRAFT_409044 [Chaetomium sp. MPI-CAGE-AT-0009]|nr:hypothetical protein B0I37DRAFT_409044 [Chaetomium sp. MPI-CAGE-AT-0009]